MSASTFHETSTGSAESQSHREAAYNQPEMVDGEYRYDVFVLGARGAGKTSFLAAFYKQLLTPDISGNNFFVDIENNKQRKFLVNIYEQLTNPNVDWPAGSLMVNEYEFRFFRIAKEKKLPLFRFQYLDYPGGYLTDDVDEADSFDFSERVKKAHSILVLIDGQKVLENIEGLSSKGGSLDKDLDTIIPKLLTYANLPVHFVVTKWDILKGQHTLERVRDELHKITSFSNFVKSRAETKKPVHLIPVSAVGDKFAVFDQTQMQMKKLTNGTAQPYYLELPVGLTIVDQLLLLQCNIPKHNIRAYLGTYVLGLFTAGIAIGTVVSDPTIAVIAELMCTTIGRRADELKKKVKGKLDQIKDQRSAVDSTVRDLAIQLHEFEAQFPESNLTRREQN